VRRLFIVLAKLLGLMQIFWSIAYVCSLIFFLQQVATLHLQGADDGSELLQSAVVALGAALSFGIAWLLLSRTDWLADRLGIEPETGPTEIKEEVLLSTGVRLIGIYVAIQAIPGLVRVIAQEWFKRGAIEHFTAFLASRLLPDALKLALGLFLVVRTASVLSWMASISNETKPETTP
jgi:hypothetical protein